MTNLGERIVVLIDMDCFFCQVEARLQPEFKGKPLAVVQYNQWKLGGIIAVNYEARDFGVTRHMRGEEAKEKCPDIILASVPALRGKSDTSRYRSAGREVIDVLKKHCNIIERASVDEAYLDITQIVENRMAANHVSSTDIQNKLLNTYIVGYSESDENNEEQRSRGLQDWLTASFDELNDLQAQKLAVAGTIVEEIRTDVYETTGFRCSAGISYNKILAKLACGLHKPNRQTILPSSAALMLFKTLPVKKVRNLGGKLGDVVIESLKCNVMSDLLRYSLHDLQKLFDEKTGSWLYNIARGIDNEPVTTRLVSKSIGVCKKFPGKQAIVNADVLKHWLGDLTAEVCERLDQDLEENERRATLLTVSFHYYQERVEISQSRSCPLNSYKPEKVAASCFNIITKATQHPIAFIGLSAGKFIAAKGSVLFRNFFTSHVNKEENKVNLSDSVETKKSSEVYDEFENNQEFDSVLNVERNDCEEKKKLETKNENLLEDFRMTSHNSFEKAMKSDHFKESFFMKILKKKHENAEDKIVPETSNFELDKENEENCEDDVNMTDPQELESSAVHHLNNSDNLKELSYNGMDKSSKSLSKKIPLNESESSFNQKNKPEEEEDEIKCSPLYSQVSNTNWSAAKMDNMEPFVNNKGNVTVKLQEIFPDLGDIDPGVISLLPIELQKEASELLKNVTKTNKKAEIIAKHIKLKKASKSKCQEAGPSKADNSIHNFLIKSSTRCEPDDSLKKCEKCHQLISSEKIIEHNDYHIAHQLQREMDKIITQDNFTKRKQTFDSSVENVKKRSTKNSKSSIKSKSIASYFS